MTKEEFASMVSDELDTLNEQIRAARTRVNFYRLTIAGGKERLDAEYQLDMLERKANRIRRLVSLPAYARIQAMSDLEIEEYKKEKVEELDLEVKRIEAKEREEQEKLKQLKAEREHILSSFNSLSDQERRQAIDRGKRLNSEIFRYESDGPYSVFGKLEIEKEEVIKKQEEIKAKTPEEIKQRLISEMEDSGYIAESIEAAKRIPEQTQLYAAVADDREKTELMARLIRAYTGVSDEEYHMGFKFPLELPYFCPPALKEELEKHPIKIGHLEEYADELMEIVQEFEGTFKKAKEVFEEEFTEDKLEDFVVIDSYPHDFTVVDRGLFRMHEDKISKDIVERLSSNQDRKDKLSKKLFKSKTTYAEMALLSGAIKQDKLGVYNEIAAFYNTQPYDVLGTRCPSFLNQSSMEASLEQMASDVRRSEEAIEQTKERIQKAKEKVSKEKKEITATKEHIAQRIRRLAGIDYKDTPIRREALIGTEDVIKTAGNRVYARDLIERVERAAQAQADMREEELKGIKEEEKDRKGPEEVLDFTAVEPKQDEKSFVDLLTEAEQGPALGLEQHDREAAAKQMADENQVETLAEHTHSHGISM